MVYSLVSPQFAHNTNFIEKSKHSIAMHSVMAQSLAVISSVLSKKSVKMPKGSAREMSLQVLFGEEKSKVSVHMEVTSSLMIASASKSPKV